MNHIITQNTSNDNQISLSMQRFFHRFHISSALKMANAYKKRGTPVIQVFQYLFMLVFSNRSMYMSMLTDRHAPTFGKDTVYRFMKSLPINWSRFTSVLSSRIIKDAIVPLTDEHRVNVLLLDDSTFERDHSAKAELLSKVYDHAKRTFCYGFRMLTLGWSDGNTFLPVDSILLSSENQKSRKNEAHPVDRRSVGYKRGQLSVTKATAAMLELLKAAKAAAIPAQYVLFDSRFSSPSSLHAVKGLGYDVISMIRKTSKMHFGCQDKTASLPQIYKENRKRRGRSRYLLPVMVDVTKGGAKIPAKVIYIRNKNKRKDYLCLICTDMTLSEEEIIRIYGKRWDIEVFFKVSKSHLRLSKECHALSHDAMAAHTAVVFTRYMMLAVENRDARDERSLGELFLHFTDELSDPTWVQAFHMLIAILKSMLSEHLELPESTLKEMVDAFMKAVPVPINERLKIA